MRTLAADIGLLAHSRTASTRTSDWTSYGASLVGAFHGWYVAFVGNMQLAKLPSYLLADAFGEAAPLAVESHVRDGFGRPVY
jgi:hypothetical protein